MRVLRGLLGALLWIVAGLLGLVSLILCVTVILLPLGIPLFRLSKALFGTAVRLMLPQAVAHPVKHVQKKAGKAKSGRPEIVEKATRKGRKLARKQRERVPSF